MASIFFFFFFRVTDGSLLRESMVRILNVISCVHFLLMRAKLIEILDGRNSALHTYS